MPASERDLVEQAQAGSLEAFDELVSIHQGRVYALARRVLGNDDDAADVQQETFVRAWRSIRKFRREAQFATWLHRITLNRCLSRKRRREHTVDGSFFEDEQRHAAGPSALACMERTEAMIVLRRTLAALPAHHRAVLVLREIEGRPFEEIAQLLGCSEESARSRASRARKVLRERMRPYLAEED